MDTTGVATRHVVDRDHHGAANFDPIEFVVADQPIRYTPDEQRAIRAALADLVPNVIHATFNTFIFSHAPNGACAFRRVSWEWSAPGLYAATIERLIAKVRAHLTHLTGP